jgi:hypothetical protein
VTKFAGADWLQSHWDEALSSFHTEVANILGQVFTGIYHIDHALKRELWRDHYVEVRLDGNRLATYDFSDLTTLVVLCHDRCIRLSVDPCTPKSIRLLFHQRQRDGGISQRHPAMEEHIQSIRTNAGLGII